mmetsp:Transcript_16190/g.48510  ORF Transcript_16190/g.48510 Transcript_16190/m.48510 type:complete len:209 (+) Transcript_16190:617-1243(+)
MRYPHETRLVLGFGTSTPLSSVTMSRTRHKGKYRLITYTHPTSARRATRLAKGWLRSGWVRYSLWLRGPTNPRATMASPIVSLCDRRRLNRRLKSEITTRREPPCPSSFHLTPRAATPRARLRTSSKATAMNLRLSSRVSPISSTGTRSKRSGHSSERIATANSSAGVVVSTNVALCRVVNQREADCAASRSDRVVTVIPMICAFTYL